MPLRRPAQWRLSTRMAVLSLLLLLVVQGLSFVAIRAGIERNARSQLSEELKVGEKIWAKLVDQRATKLTQGAALLAADFGFRDAVSSDDRDTIVSALDNHGGRIDASLTALLDPHYNLRAASHGKATQLVDALKAITPRLADQRSVVALVGDRPYQFVIVPLRAPVVVGWVVMGFEIGAGLVKDLHGVSGLHAALVARSDRAEPHVLHSSLPAEIVTDPLLHVRDEVVLAGDPYLVRGIELAAAEHAQVKLLITGSIAAAVRPYQTLQIALAGLTLVGLALFGLGAAWTARRVTQPLHALVLASERFGQGDYEAPVAHTERADEIGDLAKAFERMRIDIGEHEREIRQLAYWDALTGLPNRIQFREAVQAAIARGGQAHGSVAVIMLDLDRFKHVNDVLGYASGDRLLQGVAQRLRAAMRPHDVIARLGGDEFALLLAPADAALAHAMSERIVHAFEQPLMLTDQTVDLSAGLGIALWPEHAKGADALLSRAEVAMYAAKRRTAGAQMYDPALDSASTQTLSLLSELRRAVDADELRLYLQPKVAAASKSLCGAEALVRWQHPQRGLVPPMEFIPFAEQTGFIRQLTLWMFGEAARLQSRLAALGLCHVSVNLSTRDLLDIDLLAKLDALLSKHHAKAEGFCLEITESAIMDDPQRAETMLNRLAQHGFKLSIDDFGTGYSSLAYLKRLPVDELKIDKSFVMAMEHSDDDLKIVRSTIDLAHNLGLSVVAEGVENEAILDRLRELGCDEAQGYHLSKPLPIEGFLDWARHWRSAGPSPERSSSGTVIALRPQRQSTTV